LGLLLLLRRQQQLHLALQVGDARLQGFLLGGLCEGHAWCDQSDEQRGSQWPSRECGTLGHNPSRKVDGRIARLTETCACMPATPIRH